MSFDGAGQYFTSPGSIIKTLFLTGTDSSINGGVTIPTTLFNAGTSGWVTLASFSYSPASNSSRLSIFFDILYNMSGAGKDIFKSRITVAGAEVAFKQQQFGTSSAVGSGTRSNVIFPISGVANNATFFSRTINIQVNVSPVRRETTPCFSTVPIGFSKSLKERRNQFIFMCQR